MFSIQSKPFFILTGTFIACTAIGTVTHELGHYAAARILGHRATLHHAFVNYDRSAIFDRYSDLIDSRGDEIRKGTPFPERAEYERLRVRWKRDRLWIALGGPLQTMLTGMAGLIIIGFRKSYRKYKFKFLDWVGVFLALFWLREIFNLVAHASTALLFQKGTCFGGDEARIARLLDLPVWSVPIACGVLGFSVALYVVFRVVPSELRHTFIVAGLVGGALGGVLWMQFAGPWILP